TLDHVTDENVRILRMNGEVMFKCNTCYRETLDNEYIRDTDILQMISYALYAFSQLCNNSSNSDSDSNNNNNNNNNPHHRLWNHSSNADEDYQQMIEHYQQALEHKHKKCHQYKHQFKELEKKHLQIVEKYHFLKFLMFFFFFLIYFFFFFFVNFQTNQKIVLTVFVLFWGIEEMNWKQRYDTLEVKVKEKKQAMIETRRSPSPNKCSARIIRSKTIESTHNIRDRDRDKANETLQRRSLHIGKVPFGLRPTK
ncbi:hypothetical protein RFI_32089, partial [Reticulomyxa filosa]